MEMATVIAAIAGIVGQLFAMGKTAEAQRIREQAAAEYGPEILPQIDEVVAQEAGASAMGGLREDDAIRQQELQTLEDLATEYETGGMSPADVAALRSAQRDVSRRAASQSASVAQDLARRGQAGGSLAGVLASQVGQDELEALADMEADVVASGRNRAMQALMARGNLAGEVRGQDWRAMSDRAQAQDLMNRFNASQRQATGLYNAGLPMQRFGANMQRLGGLNAARMGVAQGAQAQGQDFRQMMGGMGNAALSFGQAWDETQDEEDEAEHGESGGHY